MISRNCKCVESSTFKSTQAPLARRLDFKIVFVSIGSPSLGILPGREYVLLGILVAFLSYL